MVAYVLGIVINLTKVDKQIKFIATERQGPGKETLHKAI